MTPQDILDIRNHTEIGTGYTKDAMLNKCADYIIEQQAIIEKMRTNLIKLKKLPKFSFLSPAGGGVIRCKDSIGNWVEWYEVMSILDDTLEISTDLSLLDELRAKEREECCELAREWEDLYVLEDTAPNHVNEYIIRNKGK